MAGLPEITVVGILVTDPELRVTPTDGTVTTFTIAANDRCYDRRRGFRGVGRVSARGGGQVVRALISTEAYSAASRTGHAEW